MANENDTEVPHIVCPTKKDSELDETIKEKSYNRSVRNIKSLESSIPSTLTSKVKKLKL